MNIKTITKIPDLDNFIYNKKNFHKFLFASQIKKFDHIFPENKDLNNIDKFEKFYNHLNLNKNFSNNLKILNLKKINYKFSLKNLRGKLLCVEKKGFRIKTNAKVLQLLKIKDFFIFKSLNILKTRFSEEFEILKTFKILNSEFSIVSNTKYKHNLLKQKIKQLDRLNINIKFEPKHFAKNKGLWSKNMLNFSFTPYSKTPQNLKNKIFKNYLYPGKIKEFFYEPIPVKGFRYFLLTDIKKKIWLIQTKMLRTNLKFLGSIYIYKYPFAFLVGIDGIPVLLHRNQLFLSCRQMKRSKNLFVFGNYFLVKIFAKYKSEKRTNIIIEKYLTTHFANDFNLKIKILNFTLRKYNKILSNKNLYINKN